MKNWTKYLNKAAADLNQQCEELHQPFAGMIEDKDPYGVIQDEINQDHAMDNMI